jgi:hypothetical protein
LLPKPTHATVFLKSKKSLKKLAGISEVVLCANSAKTISGALSLVAANLTASNAPPKLVLLRLEPDRAEIWGDASSFIAGIKLLLGVDPKKEYKDKVAEVHLR